MPKLTDLTKAYYHTRESKLGYRLMLGGTKHFGYYPPGQERLSFRRSMHLMECELGKRLGLPAGSKVLDAGCGMGRVAVHLAQDFGYAVTGLDLLDFNVVEARGYAKRHDAQSNTTFVEGDYSSLPFADASFDAVYTMETFVHAPDPAAVLKEFHRVLRPGGELVMFEYELSDSLGANTRAREALLGVSEDSAMHGLLAFSYGSIAKEHHANGFEAVKDTDITPRMMPMLKRFHKLAIIPYHVLRQLKHPPLKYANVRAAVEFWRYKGYWRYVIVSSQKPKA